MFYLIKSPGWLRKWYSNCIWEIITTEKQIYLTFDDGPHPEITAFVLDELKKYNARATFFCIGKNVVNYPEMYQRILDEGHAVGNHTYTHLNGWKTADQVYLDDVAHAQQYIDSNLFRPPYGRISKFQLNQLSLAKFQMKTIMWTALSGDFDVGLSNEKCAKNVLSAAKNGAIIVFHDSEKAAARLKYALPAVLEKLSKQDYVFEKLTMGIL